LTTEDFKGDFNMATLIRTDRNGTKYYEGMIPCDRCDGKGIYIIGVCNGRPVPSWVDGGVCFKCGGTGKVEGKWKEYTPEYEAKLEARRQARHEKWLRDHAEEIAKAEAERKAKAEAERIAKEAEERAREAEEQRIREQKALSKHIGQVGDKIDLDVTFERCAWFEIPSFRGFGTETMHIYTFRDEQGNALIWKTSKGIDMEQGETVHLTGTIKEHSKYDEERQTVLTRCKIGRQ
jgi:hypothetical protein